MATAQRERLHTAGMRAISSHERVRHMADKLRCEIDDVTGPVARAPSQAEFLDEEDSLVVAVEDVRAAAGRR